MWSLRQGRRGANDLYLRTTVEFQPDLTTFGPAEA